MAHFQRRRQARLRDGGDPPRTPGVHRRATVDGKNGHFPARNESSKTQRFHSRDRAPLDSLTHRVTFGITAFERPAHLQRLVASILRFYPEARIMVADNGREKAKLPPQVELLDVPYDCGLSAARNALVDRLETEFLLLLEEDFEFTDETRIDRFVDVLDHDPEMGFVGGSLYQEGRKLEYAVDMHRFRQTLHLEPSRREPLITPAGTVYRPCDMCFNFGLIRRKLLAMHRWPDYLKLAEHWAFFEEVKRGEQWRVAHCDQVRARHNRGDRSEHYVRQRGRAAALHREALAMHGCSRIRSDPRLAAGSSVSPPLRSDAVILGVGHSGTSIVAKMLMAAGWGRGDADEDYGESVSMREVNLRYLQQGEFSVESARQALLASPPGGRPRVFKDPRLAQTLHLWLPLFAQMEQPPTLLWVRRETQAVVDSYLRRRELPPQAALPYVEKDYRLAEQQYRDWPWGKCVVDYERLQEAVGLFRQQSLVGEPEAQPGPHETAHTFWTRLAAGIKRTARKLCGKQPLL